MSLFSLLVRAFQAAVRAEVDRAMADRRAALRRDPDIAELDRLRASLGALNLVVVDREGTALHLHGQPSADILPFPIANDRHDSTPPSAA